MLYDVERMIGPANRMCYCPGDSVAVWQYMCSSVAVRSDAQDVGGCAAECVGKWPNLSRVSRTADSTQQCASAQVYIGCRNI